MGKLLVRQISGRMLFVKMCRFKIVKCSDNSQVSDNCVTTCLPLRFARPLLSFHWRRPHYAWRKEKVALEHLWKHSPTIYGMETYIGAIERALQCRSIMLRTSLIAPVVSEKWLSKRKSAFPKTDFPVPWSKIPVSGENCDWKELFFPVAVFT